MATISSGWYKGSIPFYEITEVSIAATGSGIESWDGSVAQDGSIVCHRVGTKVNIVCNNVTEIGDNAFFKFLALRKVSGLGTVTTIGEKAFCYTPNIASIDIVPSNLTSIGASAFRMSSIEDVLDLSAVSASIAGELATRAKRWSAAGLAAVKSVVFPRTIYFDVPNTDNQQNYPDVPFGIENGVVLYAPESACTALAAYHSWNCLNRGTSKEYANWLDWYNDTINADGTFADTNKFDAQTWPTIITRLGWTGGAKTKVSDSQQLQSIIDNLVNGLPTIISIQSVNISGTHAVVVVGCDSETHKLAVVDSNVGGTTGAISWIAFEDIFVEGTSDYDGIYQINYNRPVLAPNSTWFTQGGTSIERSAITEIFIEDSYAPSASVTASWDASAAKDGSVMVYVEGAKLTIAGNGSGKIAMNADASYLFSDANRSKYFNNLAHIHNTNLLDSSRATTFLRMFEDCFALQRLDGSNWNTSNVTSLQGVFQGCTGLKELLVQPWDVQNVTTMDSFFNMYGSLWNYEMEKLDLSGWNVAKVTSLRQAISRIANMTELNIAGWETKSCTNFAKSLCQLQKLTELDLSGWDTSLATDMADMLYWAYCLRKITLGEKFTFDGNGNITTASKKAVLPIPDSEHITGADGNWYDVNGKACAPSNVPGGTFGVWYAIPALVEEDANQMVWVKKGSLMKTAAAIRTKAGTGKGYTPSEFAGGILSMD